MTAIFQVAAASRSRSLLFAPGVFVDSKKTRCDYDIQDNSRDSQGQDMAEVAAPKMAEDELLRMTTEVVAAYVSNNTLASAQLGDVIHAVYNSLRSLDGQVAEAVPEVLKPAVPVRKSITPEYPDLSRRRQEAEDAEAPSSLDLQSFAGRIPGEMGAGDRTTRWSRRTTRSSAPTSPRRSASAAAPAAARRAAKNNRVLSLRRGRPTAPFFMRDAGAAGCRRQDWVARRLSPLPRPYGRHDRPRRRPTAGRPAPAAS